MIGPASCRIATECQASKRAEGAPIKWPSIIYITLSKRYPREGSTLSQESKGGKSGAGNSVAMNKKASIDDSILITAPTEAPAIAGRDSGASRRSVIGRLGADDERSAIPCAVTG